MLEVNNLHLWRGERHLLKGIGLRIAPGQILQLLWPNGAGKTSLLRCIAGFLHAEEGAFRWRGADVTRNRDALYRDLAYLGHDTALKADLTVIENLRFACAMRCGSQPAETSALLTRLGLEAETQQRPVRSLSAGQQRRVALARLALWDATLWLLDEPASNLDAKGQARLAELLTAHLQAGGMALIATHQALSLPGVDSRSWLQPGEAP